MPFKKIGTLIATLSLLAAAPIVAQPTTKEKGQPAKPKMVCKIMPVTGSFVKKTRTCGSKEAWARLQEGSRDQTTLMISGSNSCSLAAEGGSCP